MGLSLIRAPRITRTRFFMCFGLGQRGSGSLVTELECRWYNIAPTHRGAHVPFRCARFAINVLGNVDFAPFGLQDRTFSKAPHRLHPAFLGIPPFWMDVRRGGASHGGLP